MGVDPKTIALDKCYATSANHVRKVLEVTTDRVRYAHGGVRDWTHWRWQAKDKFTSDVEREVPCDFGQEHARPLVSKKRTNTPTQVDLLMTDIRMLPG